MKITMRFFWSLFLTSLVLPVFSYAAPDPNGAGEVVYNPLVKIAQGNQPFSTSYTVVLTTPATVPAGSSIPVSLLMTPLSQPAGVSAATARSYVSMSPTSIVATQPGQQTTVTINVAVPVGSIAGGYSWKLTTSGWPTTLPGGPVVDAGHTINGLFFPPNSTDTSPPAIVLTSPANGTVYTYSPLSGVPVSVPVNFSASVGAGGAVISGLSATANGTLFPVTATGLSTLAATGSGTLQLTAAGNYLISAKATNLNGTSEATAEISVVINAPPPTITVAAPTPSANYTLTLGSSVNVPVSFSALSSFGNITALAATLNGAPVTLTRNGVGTSLSATGTATLPITSPGSYSLVFTAANAYGTATPVTVPFTVTGVTPAPTVSILTPANGAVFTRTEGSAATAVNYSFQGATSFGTVSSVVVKLDGAVITPSSLSGLNTAAVTGGGSMNFTSGGPHTLTVTVSNGGASATATSTFTIQQNPAQNCRDLTWLTPISLNKTIQGGSTMPIKFTLTCRGDFVRDTNVVISIYEVFANGTTSAAVLYPYGTGSPNPPDYAITGKKYHLNFATEKGKHRYQIDVYTVLNGTVQLLGSKVLNTAKNGSKVDDDDDDDDHDDDDDDGDDCDGRDRDDD